MLATPMQLAVATSVLASKGKRRVPRLLREVNGEPVVVPELEPLQAEQQNWDSIYEGMLEVVHGERGTAKYLAKGNRVSDGGKDRHRAGHRYSAERGV